MTAGWCDDRTDAALAQVLIDTAVLVEEAERSFESMDDIAPLPAIKTFEVAAGESVNEPDVPCFGEERVFVDESPDGQQAVHAARLAVVPDDAPHLQHAPTSTSNRTCLAASYRVLKCDEDNRMRNICGSRLVAQNANP